MALVVLKCFPYSLPLKVAVKAWVPFVFAYSAAEESNATTAERFKCVLRDHGNTRPTREGVQDILNQCDRILVIIQVLTFASGLPAIDWKQRFANSFLYFVGFKCWNRERQGHSYLSYLSCDLNIGKDDSWLQKRAGSGAIPSGNIREGGSNKAKDPLLLLEPRYEESEHGEGEKDSLKDLVMFEAQEVAYGLKRSTKYYKKVREI